MSYNGSGQFNLLYNWQNDAANGLDISSSRMQDSDQDIASGLSNCVTRDGQSPALANLPMAGFKHTNVANAVADTDYVALGQVKTLIATAATNAILDAMPLGIIVTWNSTVASIPAKFQLCDGTNGTPDLTNRFILGAGGTGQAPGITGGNFQSTLTVANLASHNHSVSDGGHTHTISQSPHGHGVNDPTHGHPMSSGRAIVSSGGAGTLASSGSAGIGDIGAASTGISIQAQLANVTNDIAATGVTTNANGSGTPFDTVPPYYTLCYIQRMS